MFGRSLQISITLCVCCMCCGFQTEKREISMYLCLFSADRTWFFAHLAANVCVRCIWVSNKRNVFVCEPNNIIIIIIIWNWTWIMDQNVQILRTEINYRYHTHATYLNTLNTNLSSNNAVIIFNEGEKTQINTHARIRKQIVSLFLWFLCRFHKKLEKK